MKNTVVFQLSNKAEEPKYQQLVDGIKNAIAQKELLIGAELPSVTSVSKSCKLSRDTVFKAYLILKEQGVIDSVPSKGYYVAGETRKVLLVLDTFKAYKEVLYHSFVNNLPDNFITDVQFHHYNVDNFKTIIQNSLGKYYKYIVMPFDNQEVVSVLNTLPADKLLWIDWNIHSQPQCNYVFQDFGQSFYDALVAAKEHLSRYESIHFVYPSYTNHPMESVAFFKKFAADFKMKYELVTDTKDWKIAKHTAYISVSDRFLGQFLEQAQELNLEPGKDVGILSYNETPMKKFIYKGISVVSTDFKTLGTLGAQFVTQDGSMQHYVPTQLTIRESL
ncbi:GntR family transcriptional regulator [Flavobacterium sp. UMI-01]|uniref:GntR family transcriptional regulator n=1 Tax=Flavobacterium sp. UMI-01 TaxID=1441053 RepID=UPI001C7CB014|nr:GntR family transcriptional regulator [Flavobacterium sp. UMI-01]GIZ08791.1 GntR family transcriptional regulator [Flavobacterium sp. UMI-01]